MGRLMYGSGNDRYDFTEYVAINLAMGCLLVDWYI